MHNRTSHKPQNQINTKCIGCGDSLLSYMLLLWTEVQVWWEGKWFITIGSLTWSWLSDMGHLLSSSVNKWLSNSCLQHLYACTSDRHDKLQWPSMWVHKLWDSSLCMCQSEFFMCRFRPSLSVDVWAQWLVVFLSEAQLVLCVGHACKLNHAFIWNVRVQLNLLGTKSLLCF